MSFYLFTASLYYFYISAQWKSILTFTVSPIASDHFGQVFNATGNGCLWGLHPNHLSHCSCGMSRLRVVSVVLRTSNTSVSAVVVDPSDSSSSHYTASSPSKNFKERPDRRRPSRSSFPSLFDGSCGVLKTTNVKSTQSNLSQSSTVRLHQLFCTGAFFRRRLQLSPQVTFFQHVLE